jgi:hypothetical protein
VRSIRLHHNLITEIDVGTFAGLYKLELLELHDNKLVRFAPMAPPTSRFGSPVYALLVGVDEGADSR